MSFKISEAKKRYVEVLDEMSALAEAVKKEERLFSEEEKTKLAALEEEQVALKDKIDAYEAEEQKQRDRLASIEKLNESRGKMSAADTSIRVSREEGLDDKGKVIVFKNMREQMLALREIAMNPQGNHAKAQRCQVLMRAATGLSEGIAQDGGYLLQTDFAATVYERMYGMPNSILPLCSRYGVQGNGLKIPALDDASRANGSRWGGITTYWANEAASVSYTKMKFRLMTLVLKKLFSVVAATDELLEDVPAFDQRIMNIVPKEIAFKMEDGIFRGNGNGQMLGILNSPALVTVPAEGNQGSTTVVFNNITKMEMRLWVPGAASSVWLFNKNVKPQLQSMIIPNTTIPAYLPPQGLSGPSYATLYGRPAQVTEYNESLGTVGDIIYADLSQYQIIDKGAPEAAQSMHVLFLTDEMVFRFTARVDGQPLWDKALTPYKGTETETPFVALAARP